MLQLAKMCGMRDLRREHRLTARSLPELIAWVEQALSRYGSSRRVTFRGRKLSIEAIVNASLLHMLSLPDDEQERILGESIGKLEKMLDIPEAQPLEAAQWLRPRDTTQATERASKRPKRGGESEQKS